MTSGVATVGSVALHLHFDDSDVSKQLQKITNKIESPAEESGKKIGDVWAVAFGNIVQKSITKIWHGITSNMDNAIKRVDTLNNASKVFEAMGYSADSVSDSMSTLKGYLDGLPTSMTDAVQGVQSLSASFGGIEKGTETYIAMNNAGLAFGATSEQIAGAITQLGQLSLDGPLDAGTWNSLRNNGFGPVFAAMAKEAGITVGELKEQFGGKGTRTVGEFLDMLNKLNVEGSGDMEALSSLARKNTEGIGTAIENVRNRIAKAIQKIIDHIGAEKISGIINGISSHFEDLANIVIGIIDFISANWSIISPILAVIAQVAGVIIAINVALKAYHKIQTAVNAVQKVFSSGLDKISSGISKASTMFKKSPIGGGAEKVGGIFSKLAETIKNAVTSIGEILNSLAKALVEPLKTALQGVGESIAGFFKALADPTIAMGALMFALAAASIAASIWLIGSAIGAILPTLTDLFNNIIMPIAQFIADTVLSLIDAVTVAIIQLTNEAIIPLGEFLVSSFVAVLETVSSVITSLTQNALIPLINTLSGAFVSIIQTVGNILTGVIKTALEGVASVVVALGDGFLKMGEAIKMALDGVSGVINAFADLIRSIASAAVAIVALVTGHSIDYGSGFAHLDGYAEGGRVIGKGTGTSDSIPAMLSNGEYVINAEAAQKVGYGFLDTINSGASDYASGLADSISEDYTAGAVGGKTINVYMTNQINNEMDAEDIGRIMMQSIRRAV